MASPTQWTWSGWTQGVGDGQGGLACCGSWGRKELDVTEWLNWTELNAGDLGSIPGSGRSTGEGLGYPLQCSWASLVAQLVKNPPAMLETWVQSLSWEDTLEKGKATHSSILAWRIPWTVKFMKSQRVRHHWATFSSLSSHVLAIVNNAAVNTGVHVSFYGFLWTEVRLLGHMVVLFLVF